MTSEFTRERRSGRRRNTGYGPDRRGAIEEAADRRAGRDGAERDRKPARLLNVERHALAAELGLLFDDLLSNERYHE